MHQSLASLKLLATTGLGAAYLLVAFLAAYPRVDAEYTAHFLLRTADCWLPQALRADNATASASVEVGRLVYPEACRYLRLNWHSPEGWGVWAGPKQATLRLPWRPDTSAVELTVRGAPTPGVASHIQFVWNGQVTAEVIPPETSRTVIFPLPPDRERHDPELRLSFSSFAVVPDLNSERMTREIGIGLVAIRYLPTPFTGDVGVAASDADGGGDSRE